ncbi:DUF488 family protein [Streptomonospora nanhaiensis]|uniref:Uncharacterized protein (DUF488 family) n=1 Tax=Streptomonospora nanhaiensis TaxID=1323731 RepID=A0A853BNU3_9ACTN|nr:DUF488 domain-containing protein [Streptomonospora nanhaiensis]MBX9387829.1 DUF488 domain-containing protein [Streptomonospora nanhaiensis]NYI97309.1 uncharacterized protein (DUF488 family) [Streptomonospora nanhaiensis]
MSAVAGRELLTFGHSTAGRERLATLLRGAGVEAVVDVRIGPGSRRDPDLIRDRLAEWLPQVGIAYRWEQDLGGFRKVPPDSPDVVWRNASFRGYAAHTRSPEFVAAMDRLLREAASARTAVMCSEAVWWRCHRRLIADFASVARGAQVRHLMHDARLVPHPPTPGVRLRADGLLVYDDTAAALRSTGNTAQRTEPDEQR